MSYRPNHSARRSVAIIGGGFSGVMVAVHLLREAPEDLKLTLLEPADRLGEGLAYGTEDPAHLLNVPAGGMSCFADEPSHFLDWLSRRNLPADPGQFVARRLYGPYLREVLSQAMERARPGRLQILRSRVGRVAASAGGYELTLTDGRRLEADRIVLAAGHAPPRLEVPGIDLLKESGRYISQFWTSPAWREIPRDHRILIIGTGLSFVDACISLRGRGHRGLITAVSRRGSLPKSHLAHGSVELAWDLAELTTARKVVRAVRAQLREALGRGADWRAVLNTLRPVSNEIWSQLPWPERSRILRHARPLWEVHRHRVAPDVGAQLAEMVAKHPIEIVAGRVQAFETGTSGVATRLLRRGSGKTATLISDWVVDCSGPDTSLRRIDSPLLKSLLEGGLIEENPLGIGIQTDAKGRAIPARFAKPEGLYVMGPLRKGCAWETTAVPELRAQAKVIATAIVDSLAEPELPAPFPEGRLEETAGGENRRET